MSAKVKIKTTVYNKPVGYTTPVSQHNVGRVEAKKIRKNFVIC